jgi:hypothetical protein
MFHDAVYWKHIFELFEIPSDIQRIIVIILEYRTKQECSIVDILCKPTNTDIHQKRKIVLNTQLFLLDTKHREMYFDYIQYNYSLILCGRHDVVTYNTLVKIINRGMDLDILDAFWKYHACTTIDDNNTKWPAVAGFLLRTSRKVKTNEDYHTIIQFIRTSIHHSQEEALVNFIQLLLHYPVDEKFPKTRLTTNGGKAFIKIGQGPMLIEKYRHLLEDYFSYT